MVAFGPKGRPWQGQRCKGHSPLRREAPGLGGQHRRPPAPSICRWTWSWSVAAARPGPGVPWLCPPRSAVHLRKGCEQDLRLPASEPSGTLGLRSHRGQPPASPQADPVGVEAGCRSFVSQKDTNSQSTPCTCSAGTPVHSTWHYLRFHPIRLSSLGGQVRGLRKEGLGVPARAQQP